MLKIAVCDDESEQAQLFRLYADNYFKKRGAEASVCVFDSADELLAASARGSFDVALLDICMPETQGLEAARELPEPLRGRVREAAGTEAQRRGGRIREAWARL